MDSGIKTALRAVGSVVMWALRLFFAALFGIVGYTLIQQELFSDMHWPGQSLLGVALIALGVHAVFGKRK